MMLSGLLLAGVMPWGGGAFDAAVAAVLGYGAGFVLKLIFDRIKHGADTIGMGDIKLLAVGGIFLGTAGLPMAVIVACVFGVLWAWMRRKRIVPFAPFFIAGMVVAILSQLI
ncbi:hypothetical protein FACS189421_06970 [Bacteroidia bacterium]|nr:hypothetical protein FACS189421_06970 [Bacteroidia bacterium]